MSKKEKRYVLKPKFTLSLIPKRDLVLGILVLVFGAFCFGYLFMGLFLGFYVGTSIYNYPLKMIYTLFTNDLKIIVFLFSILGTLTASSFSYSIWFSSFQKNIHYKRKASFIGHTSKDVVWVVSTFMTRLVTLILGVTSCLGIFYLRKELFVVAVLSAIALLLREDNHLKQSFRLRWQFSFVKMLSYIALSAGVSLIAFPYISSLNNGMQINTIESKFGISLPKSEYPRHFNGFSLFEDYFFYKKGGELYLSRDKEGELLKDVQLHPYICAGGEAKRIENLFYIDRNTPMKDIDQLLDHEYFWNPVRMNYAVKTENENAFHDQDYATIYLLNSYEVIKNSKRTLEGHFYKPEEDCEFAPPPPPPLHPEIASFDFDNYWNYNMPFVHLHLANDKNYYWNNQKVPSSTLYACIDSLFGTEKGVVLTYDENVTFQSVTATWEYLESIKKLKIAEFEDEHRINLDELYYDNNDKYDSILDQFKLRRRILSGFYQSY